MEKDVNHLFVVAKNNSAALKELTDILTSYGRSVTKSIFTKYGIFNLTYEDTEDYILYIIVYIYNTYIPNKKSFKDYVTFVMFKRLTTKIIELCKTNNLQVASLDETFDDESTLYEVIEDKTCHSIPESISFDEFHMKMASPNALDNSLEIKKKKLFILEEHGYSGDEIMEILKLSPGQYRYIKSLIKNDLEIEKIKLDLK